ncbi:MAG: ABC transporter ATP-binding protein [Clostridia bacterium]|nr:ABC transporter ATP-binding protein [Clostridia bacterium]
MKQDVERKRGLKEFKLSKYLKNYKALLFWGPFFKAVEAVTEVIVPFLMAIIIDQYIAVNNKNGIITLAVIILLLNVLGIICAILGQKFAAISGESIGRDIRNDIFKHINTLSYAELDKFTTTSLLNRNIFDVYHIQEGISMILRTVMRIPFLLIGSIAMAISINAKLSLVFLVVIPILLWVLYLIMKRLSPLLIESKKRVDRTSMVTRENLSGVRVVRAFNKQNYETERFKETNEDLLKIEIKEGKLSAILPAVISLIVNGAIIALIYFGAIEIDLGLGMSQGYLIAFINYFSQISMALVLMARLIVMITRMKTSSLRIEEILSVKNSINDPEQPIKISKEKFVPSVEFENVTFRYNETKNILENLNLKVEAGSSLGIIGGTGSGKSSIVNLILRLYDTTSGRVLLGGKDIKKYSLSFLREVISMVPQNPILFDGTIASNLRWRKSDATLSEMTKALKIAQAYDFVNEYPEFLNHRVNRGGTNFSGGQKQRLTIARALVGDPKILILDDSSSALDFATDAKLRRAISKTMEGTTLFIVSQRTNAIKDCNQIIVLDSGSVVGIGTHESLLENCDVYREIHNSQNKGGNR